MSSPDSEPLLRDQSVWHAQVAEDVIDALATSEQSGLTHREAQKRLHRYGPNRLPTVRVRSPLMRLLQQFHNPLIYALLSAGIITLWLEDFVDAAVIFGVVVINAIIGFLQEGKAEQALEAVRAMLASHASVIRNSERHEIDARELVPGDIVLLESGSRIPADLRLVRVKNLHINEAALTGESMPVGKSASVVDVQAAIADRTNMAYSGTTVTVGQARGVVVATGQSTEIGRIGTLVAGVETLATPLTRRLDQFARQITLFILILGVLTFLFGHYVEAMPAIDIFLAVVGLAVAAIPEGLPAIVTITLAVGTRVMARHKAIVRRLPAVESLGSVTVICTDKTGTLTRNEMTVVRLMLPDDEFEVSGAGYMPEGGFHRGRETLDPRNQTALRLMARCALLCNDARLHHDEINGWVVAGDPTEGALLTLALKAGLDADEERAKAPRIDEIPFESEHRFMATLHHDHLGHTFALLKGAPERVLDLCVAQGAGHPLERRVWEQRMAEAARAGQRVLALAQCEMRAECTALEMSDITRRFTLLGFASMIDPPRPEAIAAVAECRRAGIRVVMITGDHVITAAAIGHQLGLDSGHPLSGEEIDRLDDAALQERLSETGVIARASPEHKLRLVTALQAQGNLVAMTGDGVNDTPALKAADIGVAMGLRGTDAAKETADLVLTDDNFATIARAVREGRTVFDNIKKSLLFILPTNGGETGVILLALFLGLALPVTPGQILWVNMVTTVMLELALAFEPAESDVMQRPPRKPREPLVTRLLLVRIIYVTLLMIAVTFAAFHWELAHSGSLESARTAAVNMLVVGEMVYLFNVRHFTAPSLSIVTLYGNRTALWMSLLLMGVQLLFTYAPPLQQMFHSTPLDGISWLLIAGLGLTKFFAVEAEKWLLRCLGVRQV